MITNANAKIAIAMIITGDTAFTVAFANEPPTSQPTKIGVMVPPIELQEAPNWMSWLPRFPPPPRVLSIGLTTVSSIHKENPATNAPRIYTPKLSTKAERNCIATPTIPTATAARAVNL